ncbi:TrmH family RNA methyltransferase [Deinococcus koreensis]|uniref:RNA methyltransferase n=1 Tax=Deinococcus koreensis TaxID=2054903 RepID=A0A2K3V1B2_9DEIO|nr:TrmH family RNA methyltransferase [Deinococcus koreensis]PNY82575.1 RNA methyltransferase [Deinococcus koreensis]
MHPHDVITSASNPHVKRLVRLRSRRDREREGLILIEGARELRRAALAGVRLQAVYLCPELYSPEARQVVPELPEPVSGPLTGTVTALSRPVFEKVSGRENPDGVLALAAPPELSLAEPGPDAVVLVLHGLEKPGNLGAILRTADAAGASGVIVLGRGADPFGPNVIRASQGSVFSLKVVVWDEPEALAWLRERGFALVACTPDAPRVYWEAPLTGRVAPLLGAEHQGLPADWRQTERSVRIPMADTAGADSLNVATAAALMLYECVRQRLAAGEGRPALAGAPGVSP